MKADRFKTQTLLIYPLQHNIILIRYVKLEIDVYLNIGMLSWLSLVITRECNLLVIIILLNFS